MPCYKVSQKSDAPCHEAGEDCSHVNLFEIGKTDSCLNVHHDADHRLCQVRVTAYPLQGSNGELYMGELIQQLSGPDERRVNGRRMVGQSSPFLTLDCTGLFEQADEAPCSWKTWATGRGGTGYQ